MFVTLYGINNIGKSTQAKMLVNYYNSIGLKAKYLKFPIYDITPSGVFLHTSLRSKVQTITETELQMWFAINRYQFQPTLKNMLSEYDLIIAEDYTGTALAWGSSKGEDLEFLESINSKLLQEDVAILIDGQRSMDSIEEGHIHENDNQLVDNVKNTLLNLADKLNWNIIQRQEDMIDTQNLLRNLISQKLENSRRS
ncbi:hypothetical protein CL656_02915 [bacterium]|nr:hypothetical protein [bacterium]|tara:strand:- start:2508 stop:3098 length:591 start_codon:yes stop_codon:yes gene_type:complete